MFLVSGVDIVTWMGIKFYDNTIWSWFYYVWYHGFMVNLNELVATRDSGKPNAILNILLMWGKLKVPYILITNPSFKKKYWLRTRRLEDDELNTMF